MACPRCRVFSGAPPDRIRSVYTGLGTVVTAPWKACLLTQYFRACHQVFPRPPRDQDQGSSIDADENPA